MSDDGDEGLTLGTIATIAALTSAATGAATTGLALSKGSPSLPPVKAPLPPPAPPGAPPPLPPAPTDTQAQDAVGEEKRKRQQGFGVAETLLVSPLGAGGAGKPATKTLLGG